MILAGAKGSKENLASIVSSVGQQQFKGNRIEPLISGASIPSFPKFSRDPVSQGFCKSSYYQGLQPSEFFLHNVAAREGIMGANNASDTGYMQRRTVKALEDAKVMPDRTVRNTAGVIIQYLYGEDDFNAAQLVKSGQEHSFIDIKTTVSNIKSRREAGIEPRFKPRENIDEKLDFEHVDGDYNVDDEEVEEEEIADKEESDEDEDVNEEEEEDFGGDDDDDGDDGR